MYFFVLGKGVEDGLAELAKTKAKVVEVAIDHNSSRSSAVSVSKSVNINIMSSASQETLNYLQVIVNITCCELSLLL